MATETQASPIEDYDLDDIVDAMVQLTGGFRYAAELAEGLGATESSVEILKRDEETLRRLRRRLWRITRNKGRSDGMGSRNLLGMPAADRAELDRDRAAVPVCDSCDGRSLIPGD